MTRDEIIQALRLELAEYESQSDINSARTRADQWARDNGISLSDPNYLQAFSQVRGQLSIGGSGSGTATGAPGIVGLTPIRSTKDGQLSILPPMPTMADTVVPGAAMFGAEELAARLPYDPKSITQTPAYNVAGPAAITFYDRILNRPVPVVSKGVLPSGEPTTGITMGRADLQPSGEMDITAVFPSTGANIMGSGLGGTTVGLSAEQAAAAGLPPGSATGTILTTTGDQFVTPGGTLTSDQVIGTTGGTATTTDSLLVDNTGNVTGVVTGGLTTGTGTDTTTTGTGTTTTTTGTGTGTTTTGTGTGTTTTGTGTGTTTTGTGTSAEIIQNLFRTSQTKDIAAQRIGDYAVSIGGMTAEEIAAAVNPIIGEQPTFGITTPASTEEVMSAVTDFGYGTGPQGNSFITATAPATRTVNMIPLTDDQQAAELLRLNTQDAAIGTGAYTEQEAAMRALDFARRQGMGLGEAAGVFGITEDQARQKASDLGINLTTVGFRMGGEAAMGPSAVDRNLMNRAGIMGAVDDGLSKTLLNNINMVMGRS
jgi:hypothetical protein